MKSLPLWKRGIEGDLLVSASPTQGPCYQLNPRALSFSSVGMPSALQPRNR